MRVIFLLVFVIIRAAFCGYTTKIINESKGYSGGFWIVYRPEVFVIGFDGCWLTGDIFGTPQDVFNRYVQDYNDKLRNACSASHYLQGKFITVMEIVGGKAGFIDDGLHYSDDTLEKIRAYISK